MTVSIYPSEQLIEQILPCTLITSMQDSFRYYQPNELTIPKRTLLFNKDPFTVMGSMPAYDRKKDLYIVKNAVYNQGNTYIPSHLGGLVSVFARKTAKPLWIMDASAVTGFRTAATSAVVTQICMSPNSTTLSIIGAGEQAYYHLKLFSAFFSFQKIRLYARRKEQAQFCLQRYREYLIRQAAKEACVLPLQSFHVQVELVDSIDECIADADVVITTTSSTEPLLDPKQLKSTAHINCIGAHDVYSREINHSSLADSALIIDEKEATIEEAGKVHERGIEVYQLVQMDDKEQEKFREQRSIYSSVGCVLQDVFFTRFIADHPLQQPH